MKQCSQDHLPRDRRTAPKTARQQLWMLIKHYRVAKRMKNNRSAQLHQKMQPTEPTDCINVHGTTSNSHDRSNNATLYVLQP
jgi:hypothetical protein